MLYMIMFTLYILCLCYQILLCDKSAEANSADAKSPNHYK